MRELDAADLIVHAGDFVAATVLAELRALAPVEAVHGNMDDPELRASLPATRVLDLAGLRVGVVHDAGVRPGRAERLARKFPGCAAVVYGHTHLPEVTRCGSVWILNPGSPTERRRASAHTMIRLRVRDGALTPELVVLA